jgi:hypothetical protein
MVGYSSSFKIIDGTIRLYKGWVTASETHKIYVLAHELGHALMTGYPTSAGINLGHTDDGSLMDANGGSRMIHAYQQLAMKILYSKNPGDSL